jgi:poly-gamma-glutamate synthesis protein (capsule biosynthesis protein)
MLVYYSLGNYVNSTASEENDIGKRMLGAMADITIKRDENGKVIIDNYTAHPIVTYVSQNKKNISVFPMNMFNDELAKRSFTVKLDTNFSKAYLEQIWDEVIGNFK